VAQVAGDFSNSKKYYQQAMLAYNAFDDKAKISASELGATASSLVLNDNAIPYRGPGFERIMLHQYQALNCLFSGGMVTSAFENPGTTMFRQTHVGHNKLFVMSTYECSAKLSLQIQLR